jgi:hypothetical protein
MSHAGAWPALGGKPGLRPTQLSATLMTNVTVVVTVMAITGQSASN